jgi:hypothetical protein
MALASALRRHSLQKNKKKIIDGKKIKDPAFKALFEDMNLLEHFLKNMNSQAVKILESMGPLCLNSLKMSEMICDFKNCTNEYEKDARFYHAAVSKSMGSAVDDGFQDFVDRMEDTVFAPIVLQLNTINEIKLKLVEMENIKRNLEKKEKTLKKLRNLKVKKDGYKKTLKENEIEYSNILKDYNKIYQYIFDTMNGLSKHKGSIVLNVLNGLKKAQVRFFSNATVSLRACVKNLVSKDDRTESTSKSDLSKELDDRASKSIIKVDDILKQVSLEDERQRAKRKRELKEQRRKGRGSSININKKGQEKLREIKVDELIIPIGLKNRHSIEHTKGKCKPNTTIHIDESTCKNLNNNTNITVNMKPEIDVEHLTPLRKRWLEQLETDSSLNTEHMEGMHIDNDDHDRQTIKAEAIHQRQQHIASANEIKEILVTLKEKYKKNQITKSEKKQIKKLLKNGKHNEAIEFMGEAITRKLQNDTGMVTKDDFTFDD